MASALTVTKVLVSEREKRIRYGVVLSGNYAQATRGQDVGEVLKLETAANPKFLPNAFFGPKGAEQVTIVNGPAFYSAEILPGANGNHWLLKVGASAGVPATELAAAGYPAALTGDLDFQIEASANAFD